MGTSPKGQCNNHCTGANLQMENTKKDGAMEQRMKAMRLSMFQESDADDFEACVRDVMASTGLTEDEARIVAGALREELLPKVAQTFGLDEEDIRPLMGGGGDAEHATTEFADDETPVDPMDDAADEEEAGDELALPSEDTLEDGGEEDDLGSMETLEIQVPAGKMDDVQKALDEILGDDTFDAADDFGFEAEGDTAMADDIDADGKVMNNMDNEKLAERRARREAIVAQNAKGVRTAGEDGKPRDIGLGDDTSHNGKPFQYADGAQMKGEDRYEGMTLDDSGGNSLREQNPTFADLPVPTKNPENLQLKDNYKTFKFDGPEGELEYHMSSEAFEVPSESPDRDGNFAVPTQMTETLHRKTTVASEIQKNVERVASEGADDEDQEVLANTDAELFVTSDGKRVNRAQFEDHVINKLVEAGYQEREVIAAGFEKGLELYGQLLESERTAQSKSPATFEDIKRAAADRKERIDRMANKLKMEIQSGQDGDEDEDTMEEMLEKERKAMEETFFREAELYKKRVKTAYGISSRLVVANVLPESEIDSHVNTWLKDNLSVEAMLRLGSVMLRSAQTNSKRLAQANAEGGNVRTAGVSVNPALVSPTSGTGEVKNRLANLFSIGDVPRAEFDRYQDDARRESRNY